MKKILILIGFLSLFLHAEENKHVKWDVETKQLEIFPTKPNFARLVDYEFLKDTWVSARRLKGKTRQFRIYNVKKNVELKIKYPFGDSSATYNMPVTRKGDFIVVKLRHHQMLIADVLDQNEGADDANAARKALGVSDEDLKSLPMIYSSGDSISLGYWPYLEAYLSKHLNLYYQRELDKDVEEIKIRNNGRPNLAFGVLKKAYETGRFKPKYIVMNFGLHCKTGSAKGLKGYGEWIQKMNDLAKENGARFIWINTTPYEKNEKSNADIVKMNAEAKRLAEELGFGLIDMEGFIWAKTKELGAKAVWSDGVHFTKDIQKAQGKFIASEIRRILAK